VKTHVPEAPPAWDRITIFHLLTHTAGFRGLQSPPAGRQPPVKSADGTVAGFVTALMQRPLESQPGERFNYTNSGYFILGQLIQKPTGQSYETFIRDLNLVIDFVADGAGRVTKMVLVQGTRQDRATRVK
jgi:CubicO group peptidase (beta-lactamase class C family)